jgi:hypothetical protein
MGGWEKWEMHTEFYSENLNERNHLLDQSILDARIILKWILIKYYASV